MPSGHVASRDGLGIAYYDLGGSGQDLVLVHATGFCAAVLAPLADALGDSYRCVAVDLRAHGRSERPEDGEFGWRRFAEDVLAVCEELGLRRPAGFGHSCGGAALLLAEEDRPGSFSSLYCYEPVVFPGEVPPPSGLADNPLSRGALRRRNTFASRETALSNFSSKSTFDRLRKDVLAAYVDNGFEESPDGSLSLRCRREDESEIYASSFGHDAFARFPTIGCPVTLACGETTDAFGPELLELFAGRIPEARTHVLGGLGHFGPLEDPDAVARSLRACL